MEKETKAVEKKVKENVITKEQLVAEKENVLKNYESLTKKSAEIQQAILRLEGIINYIEAQIKNLEPVKTE